MDAVAAAAQPAFGPALVDRPTPGRCPRPTVRNGHRHRRSRGDGRRALRRLYRGVARYLAKRVIQTRLPPRWRAPARTRIVETLDYEGEFHHLHRATQAPIPLTTIPILIGGAGPKTLRLVRDFADWWNVHVRALDKLDDARSKVGDVHVSIQQMVAYVPDETARNVITQVALQRFAHSNPIIGTGPELVDHFGRLEERGIERVYVWFCDFAPPETLAAFGSEVIAPLASSSSLATP
jgi:alkanesulfonate monooxygenase SsuD/methylene tetrahydromethanopterin reductase-like flavin-dependent oxidoreductase (luciferase family)